MRLFALSLLLMVLVGCGGGPDAEALRKDAVARLSNALPEGIVSIVALDRRGSQADTKAPPEETRRIVYFDATLKLDRDFDFGAWDSPGVAGMVSALGTGPKGITGLTSGGNKSGDLIRAHGTALYQREAGGWAPVVSGGFKPSAIPAYVSVAAQGGTAGLLDSMRKILEAVPKDVSPFVLSVIEQEINASKVAIQSTLARAQQGYGVAAGPEHGQYLRFAQALADPQSVRVVALVTRGGEENLRMLRDGKVPLALSQADAALAAYEGKGNFQPDGPNATLRAIGSLYPEPVHVIVRGDSPILATAALAGRRVAVGPEGSASRTTALRVLEAHGLDPKALKLSAMPFNEALAALREKELDAVIQVIGAPADRVRDALTDVPLRLVPLAEKAVAALAAANAGYFAYTIPRGAYAVQREDVPTVATAALLLVNADMPDTEVGVVTQYVFGRARDYAGRGSAQGMQVSAANARLGLSIPLHVAAAKALDALASAAKGRQAGRKDAN